MELIEKSCSKNGIKQASTEADEMILQIKSRLDDISVLLNLNGGMNETEYTGSVMGELEVAKYIVTKLQDEMHRAIMLRAMHNRGGYDRDIAERFDNSYEAWGYNVTINAIYFELVMSLMRIFDRKGQNTASLPELIDVLKKPNIITELLDDEREWWRKRYKKSQLSKLYGQCELQQIAEKEAERAGRENIQGIMKAIDVYESRIKGHHVLARLRSHRDKYLAHNALDTEKYQPPRYGYESDLIDMTYPIIADLSISIIGLEPNYGDSISAWSKKADDFWRMAAHIGKQEP